MLIGKQFRKRVVKDQEMDNNNNRTRNEVKKTTFKKNENK